MESAACKGSATTDTADSDPFFPKKGKTSEDAVLKFCIKCRVRAECSAYADFHNIKVGVWGGKRRTRTTHGPIKEHRRPNTFERPAA